VRLPAVAALALAVGLVAAASGEAAPRLVEIAAAASPVHVAAAPGDATRLYVVEKAGRILVLRAGAQAEPFLTMDGLFADGEGGLLSVAFAPDYASSGLLYTYSTTADLQIEIDEFRRSSDPERADPASRRPVIRIPHAENANHWGGQLQFGPDGFLYAGTGDGGGSFDPAENAENLGSLLGKLLRVDPRSAAPYGIPVGNPFVGLAGARPEIWAYGLRNPWRFSFDRATGDLTLADVGQGDWEEVDYAPAGTGAGAFYGWDAFEGFARLDAEPLPAAVHTPPVLVRSHADGDCSIIGGYVVRAPDLPSFVGRYLYTDLCTGAVRSTLLRPAAALDDAPTGLSLTNPSSFGEDLGGCLYVSSLAGDVFRITESPAPVVPCAPAAPPSPVLVERDTVAPHTTIVRGPPARTTNRRVTLVATASEPSTFDCDVDGATFSPCTSPFTTPPLAEGPHTAAVRAIDEAGNVDGQPAAWAWRVDFSPLRRWDLEVLLARLRAAIRAGRRVHATLRPHAPGRISVQLRTAGGKLLAADLPRAAAAVRVDLGPAPRTRPLVLVGRFGAVSLSVRVQPRR